MEEKAPVGVNHSSRPRTLRLLAKHSGSKQVENTAKKVLSRIVPALSRSIKRTFLRPVFMLNYFTILVHLQIYAVDHCGCRGSPNIQISALLNEFQTFESNLIKIFDTHFDLTFCLL